MRINYELVIENGKSRIGRIPKEFIVDVFAQMDEAIRDEAKNAKKMPYERYIVTVDRDVIEDASDNLVLHLRMGPKDSCYRGSMITIDGWRYEE